MDYEGKKVILTLGILILAAGVVCACAGKTEQDTLQSTYDALGDAQMPRTLLSNHQNVERHVINWNAEGEEVSSFYEYMDDEMFVQEISDDKSMFIQYKDGCYVYDPSRTGKIQVYFTMSEIAAQEWEDLMDTEFGFSELEGEGIIETAEYEDSLHITMEVDAQSGKGMLSSEIAVLVEDGDKLVNEAEIDPETYNVQNAVVYLEKSDGTRIKAYQTVFSYDVEPYEPSEEMLQCINGTDRTITLVADPGTKKEKTYTKSCGANGVFAMYLGGDYEKFYLDESCTEEYTGQDQGDDILVYTAEGK